MPNWPWPRGRSAIRNLTFYFGGSIFVLPRGGSRQPTDVSSLTKQGRLGLSEEDLLRLVRPIPMLVDTALVEDDPDVDVDRPNDVLDPSTRRQIRGALDHLGCRDLYDALGVTRDAPVSYIASRGDAEQPSAG